MADRSVNETTAMGMLSERNGDTSEVSSSYNERVRKIQERIQNMQFDIEADRTNKLAQIDQQISFVDDKVTDWHHSDQKRFVLLQERLAASVQYVESYRQERDYEESAFTSELSALEAKIAQKFQEERQADLDMEKRLSQLMNDRFGQLRGQLAEESKTRYDTLENLKNCLENDFPKLNDEIKMEVMQREQGDLQVQTKISEEQDRVTQLIEGERKNRGDSEEEIIDMLKDMITKVRDELEGEKTERGKNEDVLLGLLEATCQKLNKQGARASQQY